MLIVYGSNLTSHDIIKVTGDTKDKSIGGANSMDSEIYTGVANQNKRMADYPL